MVSMSRRDWSAELLDLLNTTPVIDGVAHDQLGTDRDAMAWLTAHGCGTAPDIDAVRRLRNDLQAVVRGDAGAARLADYVQNYVRRPRIADDGVRWELEPEPDWPARMVFAWSEIARNNPGRLRACGNPECRLFLFDRTRAGTARWCSMSVCGNRMKARRHYSRANAR